jgi:putative acyl-CoA dehydrogenase
MNDAFLVLAQASKGLTCFLLPRHLPDGEINHIRIMRLKEKLGNRSNASAELEFEGAWGQRVGPEGRGIATIIEMVNGTRLDCVTGSAALMRQAVSQAIHHAHYRHAFGSVLIDKEAMINVLADLEIETEAAVVLMARLASCFDRGDDEHELSLRRILTPIAKFLVTKRCTEVVHEALECLGGNGFVEESILPRLLRESPLNAIWEGSGNVIALDVLRAARTHPDSVEALRIELARSPIGDSGLVDRLVSAREGEARAIAEQIGVSMQAGLLAEKASSDVADAFLQSRLQASHNTRLYGTLPFGKSLSSIVERAIPV